MIVAAGLLIINPSTIQNTQAQTYANEYGYDSSQGNYYAEPKSSNVEIQKISCINDNKNINGIDITEIPQDNTAAVAAANQEGSDGANTQNGNGFADKINFNKNLVNICVNVNVNEQIRVTEPAEPETPSLTVKKEVFGCNTFATPEGTEMRCEELAPDSSSWLPCNDPDLFTNDPTVPKFCERLQTNFFDIEVLDDQDTQLQQFEGSAAGTTINLQPGTYAVHEIKDESNSFPPNVLYENPNPPPTEQNCIDNGFSDGGELFNPLAPANTNVRYHICFNYEDEQGNDCSTVTLAEGENKVCTVKNYIRFATN
jgi:hypothetical protein